MGLAEHTQSWVFTFNQKCISQSCMRFSPKKSKAKLFNSARDWTNPTCHTYHLKMNGQNCRVLEHINVSLLKKTEVSRFKSFMMAMLTRCSQHCPLDRCQHFSANCLHQLKSLWSPFIPAQNRKNHVARSHRLTVRESQWLLMRCCSWVKRYVWAGFTVWKSDEL